MSQVGIIMSTYNGGEYIEEQIKSIYEQSFRDFTLYVRDDGSTDIDFVKKLQQLQARYGFQLFLEENIGFLRSFMKLLQETTEELIAFADQDDIWLENKLLHGVEWFRYNNKCDVPILFHSAYDYVDNHDNIVGHFYFSNEHYDFRRSITENHYSGFSMLINCKLREMMLQGDVDGIDYHDWWAAMIVQAFGIGYSDKVVGALHRVHGENVTMFNMKTRIKWLKDCFVNESGIHLRAIEFKRCFGELLSAMDAEMLDIFAFSHYNFIYAIKKCFYLKRWRPMLSSEIMMRLLMLIGKV